MPHSRRNQQNIFLFKSNFMFTPHVHTYAACTYIFSILFSTNQQVAGTSAQPIGGLQHLSAANPALYQQLPAGYQPLISHQLQHANAYNPAAGNCRNNLYFVHKKKTRVCTTVWVFFEKIFLGPFWNFQQFDSFNMPAWYMSLL